MVVKGLSGMEVVGRGRDLEEENVGSKQSQAEYGFSKPKRHYMNLEEKENIYLV